MTTQEIERALRRPAPDEPLVLPALVLPIGPPEPISARSLRLRGPMGRPITMRLAVAMLLLVGALVGALATGALRLQQLADPLRSTSLYSGRGLTIDYPDGWTRLTPPGPDDGAFVSLIVSSAAVEGCRVDELTAPTPPPPYPSGDIWIGGDQTGTISSVEDRIYACLIERPMAPGETRLIVSRGEPQIIGVGPFGDFAERFVELPASSGGGLWVPSAELGFTETIDGMPAKLVVRSTSVIDGADEVRTWLVAQPGSAGGELWFVQAVLRGPELDALRAQADAIARSLDFSATVAPLADGTRDAALATAIDARDRESRRSWPGVRFLGCLPRTPGSVQATIVDGPLGLLTAPLEVTCTTTVEPTAVGLWRATLTVSWPAGQGMAAGRWARELYFEPNGRRSAEGQLEPRTGEPIPFPGSNVEPPPPGEPETFEPGQVVRVLHPGTDAGFSDVDTSQLPPNPWVFGQPGGYLVIVSGPETFDGRPWYVVDTGGDLGGEVGWVAASAGGRPLLEFAEPICPANSHDVTELAYLPAIARRLCAGESELTFGPVQAGRPEGDATGLGPSGTPDWLAGGPTVELFGAGGVGGLDRGLPAVVAPSAGSVPMASWITVTGHFADPASATCSWTYPSEWGTAPEPPDVQRRRCSERFVVTGFEPAEAP